MSGDGAGEEAPEVENPLDACPVVIRIPVAWGEMDAFGHVNNVVYFRYLESARIAYFDRIEYMEVMHRTGVGPIVASASCRFRKALVYPDTIRVGARVTEVGEDRFTVGCYVWSERLDALAAEGRTLVVSYDYRAEGKAPLQHEILEGIRILEGEGPASSLFRTR